MRSALAVVVSLLAVAVSAAPASAALRLVGVARGFALPVDVASTPKERGRLYVVEQAGVVKVVARGRVRARPFLDIRDRVSCCGERGLLSLAFHPAYPRVRRIYVNYTNRAGDTRIVAYRVNRARTRAVPSTARVLLAVRQPYANHNGGQIAFGRDGRLYVGMGDGGSAGDPENRAQTTSSRLGKLLRVNVRTGGVRIVALGLRNPWRFSLDRRTGLFWIADVGQSAREEIDVFRPGARGLENYGWRRFEGTALYSRRTALARRTRYVPPVHEYGHAGGACSVTGGFVYRGSRVRSARGRYFFGDYCTGRVSSFRLRNGRRADLRNHPRLAVAGGLSSFGEGPTGELYLVSHRTGRIFRLAST
ncbi:MAG: PQQ-dependent sugar dehydrogenase [Actinomycetota bacterium]|nr:PQQ-dependent sugar dehydrogenase [Actinomycetota bacterium]